MKRSILRSNRTLLACFVFAVIATITGLMLLQPKHSAIALIAADPSTIPACAGNPECFAFTIDTRLTDTIDTDPSHLSGTATTFAIPTSSRMSTGNYPWKYDWIINWGDDTVEQIVSGSSSSTSAGISHTYASAGRYQITIRPTTAAAAGWMNSFGFNGSTSGGNTAANKNMFYSIDTPFTNLMRSANVVRRFESIFDGAKNAIGIPENLFANISTTGNTNLTNLFTATFAGYAYNSTTASIPAGLFANIDTSSVTDFFDMFRATFSSFAYNSTVSGPIPADLFAQLDTSKGVKFSSMFSNTFHNYARKSSDGTIPAGLFAKLDTSSGTSFNDMFTYTFSGYANSSSVGVIPASLFASLDTSKGTTFVSMFSYTFSDYANASTDVTIPSGLFTSIDTSVATSIANMFYSTFMNYAPNSTVATIPADLFTGFDTSMSTSFLGAFYRTFYQYGNRSTSGTIPSGLFANLDTSKGANFANMFYQTFYGYATGSSVGTIPDDLFESIDTSAATTLTTMFNQTFDRYAQRTATFKIGDTLVKTMTFTWPYATRNITIDETSTHKPTINKGDIIVPSYHALLRRITQPTGNYASISWYRTDGTSCDVGVPTPDCGAQDATTLATFPNENEWAVRGTSTEKGNVTFYGKVMPAIDLETSADVTSVSAAFQNVIYKFSITNSGNVPVTGLAIDYSGIWADDSNPGFSGNPGSISEMTCSITPGLGLEDFSLAPNTTVDCFVTYKAEQNDIDRLGGIDLRAVASGTAMFTDEAVTTNASGVHVAASATPALSLNKIAIHADESKAIDDPLVVGETINYYFVVTNDGFATVRNILIDDETGDFTGTGAISAITCPKTELAPFEIMTCAATYIVTSEDPATIKNEAHAEGVGTNGTTEIPVTSASSSATIPYSGAPALTLTKSHEPLRTNGSWVKDNDKITYIFRIANTGNVSITSVSIDDLMVDAEHTASCSGWAIGGTLTPGQIVECEANYPLTQADIDATHVDNTAKAIGTYGATAVVSADDTDIAYPVTTPDITITVTATPTEVRSAGEVITYNYTVVNNGNATLTGINVEDAGPAGGTGTMSAITCEWPGGIASVTPQDAPVACSATYTVTQEDIDTQLQLINTASAIGYGPAQKQVSSQATATVTVNAPPQEPEKPTDPTDPNGPDETEVGGNDESAGVPATGTGTSGKLPESTPDNLATPILTMIIISLGAFLIWRGKQRRKGSI